MKSKNAESDYLASLTNLSCIELAANETNQFKLGLEYSFIDKYKHLKNNLPANFELLVDIVSDNLQNWKCEDFYDLLLAYVVIFTENIYATHNNTYKNLKHIINELTQAMLLFLAIKNHVLLSWIPICGYF